MCRDSKECKMLNQPPKKKRRSKKEVRFRDLKKLVFERDQWRCVLCGSQDDLTIHHLKEGDDLENLITVCSECHKRIHKKKVQYEG